MNDSGSSGGGGDGGIGGNSGGDVGGGGNGYGTGKCTGNGDGRKRGGGADTQICNLDIHPILTSMMKTVLDNSIPFGVNSIFKLAGMEDIQQIPRFNRRCY